MELIEKLNWRYATKKFDATKKISEEDFETIKEAIWLSASSYGLQPLRVLVIKNPEVREKLKPHTWGQSQVTDASHYLVFTSLKSVTRDDIESYSAIKAQLMGKSPEELQGYVDFVDTKLTEKSPETMSHWTSKQAYLALGTALLAAAELSIDTCPIEGLEPEKYDEILGLGNTGYKTDFALALGYRHTEDATQNIPKSRRPKDVVFGEV